jgi:hypothetical protein
MNRELLISVDKLLAMPYKSLRFFIGRLPHKGYQILKGPKLVIKLMGLGSITFFSSLCEEKQIDKSKITLLTLESNRTLCNLLGFTHVISIRHSGLFVFLWDCAVAINKSRKLKPTSIIDYERCSNAVGVFRLIIEIFFCTASDNREDVSFRNGRDGKNSYRKPKSNG